MVKKLLAVFIIIIMLASFMTPAVGVLASSEKADITDYTPVIPDGINIGTVYSTGGTPEITLTSVSSGVWRISALGSQESIPSDYSLPMGGGYWIPPCADVTAGTYVLSFNARNKSPEGTNANAVFGLFDGSMGGTAAGWNWKGQYVWAQEITSDEWTRVSRTFTIDYTATGTEEKSNARLKIGLGTGNTFSQFANKENFDFRPGAALDIDVNTLYLAKESAYDVVNTVSLNSVMPGATFTGNAKVVNQVMEKGSLDQSMTYFVTDTDGNVTDAMSISAGQNGDYTVFVAENASYGQYVITARSYAYNTDKTENFIQHPVVITVGDEDYGDVSVAIEPEKLGTATKLTANTGTVYDYGITLREDANLYTFTAEESQTTVPNGIARPAGGIEWKFDSGKKGDKYILTFRVKKNNNSDVVPNLVYGIGDSTMGGKEQGWIWKTQTYYAMDVTSAEWQTVAQEITLPCNPTSGTVVTLGLGAGSSHDSWKDNADYAFRPGGSVVVDMDSFKLVKPGVCGINNVALSATDVLAGDIIRARAEVVNAAGVKADLDQSMEYAVLDSATRKNAAADIIITPDADGTYIINIGTRAKSGEYVAVATNATNGTIVRKGLEFTVEAVYEAPQDYVPLMKCAIDGDMLSVRTSFNDEYDLLQKINGITAESLDHNNPVDFTVSGLVSKQSETMTDIATVLCYGVDEATPFKFNGSNIGANHGQSNGILVTCKNHGKTYADIGSLWEDSAGAKWNLLKVADSDKLLFLSENFTANINKYYFKNSLSGVLTHVECAEHTADIVVESAQTSQQIYPSNQKTEKTVYTVIDGVRYKLTGSETRGCDYVEIVEKYNIMNPALIGKALRENRPSGGYTEPQNIAIGSPLVAYNMTYRIMPDGTVFSIFDHEILEDISFEWYGAQQTIARVNAFGGGVHRYIPKLKPFSFGGVTCDFRTPVNATDLTISSSASFQLTRDLWENGNIPDRQTEYFRDNSSDTVASFTGGFLPIMDGEPSKRSSTLNAAGFIYRSKKTYPYFADAGTFADTTTKNKHIRGVAYKKYNSTANDDVSYYTIAYENDVYLYIDCHKAGTKELNLSETLVGASRVTQLEKSSNVSYTQNGGKLSVSMNDGTYGYLVLRVTRPAMETVKLDRTSLVSVDIKNNTHSSQSARLILAFYDTNGYLLSAKPENITAGDYQTYRYTTSDIPENTAEVRVFLWDSKEYLKPISRLIRK